MVVGRSKAGIGGGGQVTLQDVTNVAAGLRTS